MSEVSEGSNILKTDASIPTTYDYIQFYYTSQTDNTQYTTGKLIIDNTLKEPCFYSYAFISLQKTFGEKLEYKTYYLDPSEIEFTDKTIEVKEPMNVGTYVDSDGKPITSESGESPFSITATDAKPIRIHTQTKDFSNNITVTKVIQLRGTGNSDYRSVKFKTTGSAEVTICASTGNTTRQLAIYDSTTKKIVEHMPMTEELKVETFTLNNPGEYYIASKNSGLDIGYIKVKEYYAPIFEGAWKSLGSINNPQEKISDIEKGTYIKDSSDATYYANTNLYDYYSDWELTGNSLYDITEDVDSYYNIQGIIYNKYISEYFKSKDTNKNTKPLYFSGLKHETVGVELLNNVLYNGKHIGNIKTISAAAPGLVENTLNNNQKVTSSGIELPYFNKEFLEGKNSAKTVIGKVYENVEFPFVMNENTGYYEFDSINADHTVRLKEDTNTGKYFLDRVGANEAIYRKNEPNFFPLTGVAASGDGKESQKNNMFGMEMELKFSLTPDGKINFYDQNGNVISKDILFNISGDDDVWIYIDNNLVLDIGGTHQEIAGTIDFATGYSAITLATEDGDTGIGDSNIATFETATSNGISANNIVEENGKKYFVKENVKYLANSFDNTSLLDGKEHTLKMFYMERGSYSSNLKISFNFPVQDAFKVSNKVDISSADTIFEKALGNLPDFEFSIKNMATIGKTLPVENAAKISGFGVEDNEISDYNSISSSNTSNGLQLVSGIEYTKTFSDGTTQQEKIENGIVKINNGEKISFTNKFRTGSYIQTTENLNENLKDAFETTWKIKQDDSDISNVNKGKSIVTTGTTLTGTGYIANDNRSQSANYVSVKGVTRPQEGAIVYRNYDNPDLASKIDLQIEYTNTLKVGEITLERKVSEKNADQKYEYKYLIEFTNVAGLNLESKPITKTVKVKNNEPITISGIPIGTEYKITEVVDDALKEIKCEEKIHNNIVIKDLTVSGKVAEKNGTANQKYIFVNDDITKGYGQIEITKVDSRDHGLKLPYAVFKLEKLVFDSATQAWVIDTSFTSVEATTNIEGIARFTKLDFGKYRLIEMTAPDGYNITNQVTEVDIDLDNLKSSLTIENKPKLSLPSAGAIGKAVFIIAGIALISTVIILKIKKKNTK